MLRIIGVTALALVAAPAFAVDLGISISLGEPGFYGRINIGDAKPDVIYTRPVIVYREHPRNDVEPIYLHVPPGYEKHWRKHCHEYNACGRPVYFVRDSWYQKIYVPRHHEDGRHWGERRDYYDDENSVHPAEGHWDHHH